MASYSVSQQVGSFGLESMLNYTVNVYDDASTLRFELFVIVWLNLSCISNSIVTVAGAHGTHVAAITSAFFPDDASACGVAPGAQLISLKIGDTRLGSMETGTGLTRAANTIIANGCHLCNMSYGEDASECDRGRFIELLKEMVIDRNIVFISSAGNAGSDKQFLIYRC